MTRALAGGVFTSLPAKRNRREEGFEKNETRISEKTPTPEPSSRILYHGIARRHGCRHDLDGSRAAILYAGLSQLPTK
jgi:hypothetical protein